MSQTEIEVEFTEVAHFYDRDQTGGMPALVNRRTGEVYQIIEVD